jgi:hypothetical protein
MFLTCTGTKGFEVTMILIEEVAEYLRGRAWWKVLGH